MDSTRDCEDDYRLGNWPEWLSSVFVGDSTDWCVSMLPSFFNPVAPPVSLPSSMGCCFVAHYGEYGFYHKADNVKTFGTR